MAIKKTPHSKSDFSEKIVINFVYMIPLLIVITSLFCIVSYHIGVGVGESRVPCTCQINDVCGEAYQASNDVEVYNAVSDFTETEWKVYDFMNYTFTKKQRSIDYILKFKKGDCTEYSTLARYWLQEKGYQIVQKHGFVSCFDYDGNYTHTSDGRLFRNIPHDWAEATIKIKVDPALIDRNNCKYEEIGGGVW